MPLPKPNKGEERNKFISRCISFAVDDGMPQDQAVAACHTAWRKAKGISEPKESANMLIEYAVPIESSATIDGDFTIQGIAINETTTSNGHKFIAEELSKSAHTLIGVPLLKDHNNSVDSIVGKVNTAHFNETTNNIPFKAVVKDPKIKQLIKDGLLNSVSVGAHVDPGNIEELENGDIVPHGITFKELSVVAIGADSGATFGVALNNAYKRLSNSNENLISDERGKDKMTKENKISEEDKSGEKEEVKEVKEDVSEKILATLSAMDKRLAKLESSDEDEPEAKPEEPKEEPAKETKEEPKEEEEESEEEVEEKGDYKMTQSHSSFGIERKSYLYN